MFDGLWVGEWRSNVNDIRISTGVLVFRKGKIFGGNDRVYFIGHFDAEGDRFQGNIQATYYAGEPLGIFGLITVDQAEDMSITGHISGNELTLEGTLLSNRKMKMHGLLHRKASAEIF